MILSTLVVFTINSYVTVSILHPHHNLFLKMEHFLYIQIENHMEKEMATHPSVLAWRIPGMGEPDGLPSVGSHRVGHD